MSLNGIEQLVYEAADSGNTDLISYIHKTSPSSVDLNKRNPDSVRPAQINLCGHVTLSPNSDVTVSVLISSNDDLSWW